MMEQMEPGFNNPDDLNSRQFKILAETIIDKTFLSAEEIEILIELHFKIWLSNMRNSEQFNDDIIKERNKINSIREQYHLQRTVIEKQLFDAKELIKKGEYVDKNWMSRANFSFRITKSNIVKCQHDLTNLAIIEKKRQKEFNQKREDEINSMKMTILTRILKERYGVEYLKEIFSEVRTRIEKQ